MIVFRTLCWSHDSQYISWLRSKLVFFTTYKKIVISGNLIQLALIQFIKKGVMCHENSLKKIILHHKPLIISNPTLEPKSMFPITMTSKGIPSNSLKDIFTHEPLPQKSMRLSEWGRRMQWVEGDSFFPPGNEYLFFFMIRGKNLLIYLLTPYLHPSEMNVNYLLVLHHPKCC